MHARGDGVSWKDATWCRHAGLAAVYTPGSANTYQRVWQGAVLVTVTGRKLLVVRCSASGETLACVDGLVAS